MVRISGARERGPAYLSVTVNHKEVHRRPLTGPVTLGRSLDCDVCVEDLKLSRRHCQIEPALEGDGWVVTDLGSKNGTHVNGKKISERTALNHRDVLNIGGAFVKFYAYGYIPPRPADPSEALLMPARTNAALSARTPTPHQDRPLPVPAPRANNADSTIAPSPSETLAGDRPLPFTRPPARPIVRPVEE